MKSASSARTVSPAEFDSRLNSYSKTALAVAAVGALGTTEAAAQVVVHNITAVNVATDIDGVIDRFTFTIAGQDRFFDVLMPQASRTSRPVVAPGIPGFAARGGDGLGLALGTRVYGVNVLIQNGYGQQEPRAGIEGNALQKFAANQAISNGWAFQNSYQALVAVQDAPGARVTDDGSHPQPAGQFAVHGAATGYIGFKVFANGSYPTYFGWLRARVVTDAGMNGVSFTLLPKIGTTDIYGAYAAGSINAGEVAAAVPEPATIATSLGLLALGAAGVREFRRRRKTAVSAVD